MAIDIRRVHSSFVGEVRGIDITRALARDDVAAIEHAMHEHAVLVFPDQPLTDEQQVAFTRNFGELEVTLSGQMAKPEQRRFQQLELGDISNLDDAAGERLRARDDARRMYSLGNRLWHSDASFRAVGAGYTLLHARVVPARGGHTEFADMRAAYDALCDDDRREADQLVCEHSIVFSREQIGLQVKSDEHAQRLAPVQHRLVLTDPVNGRKSLYLSSHIGGIVGWPVPEARAYIRDLIEHATQREFVYSHAWQVNDLVMWDNRTVMHRARRFRDLEEKRDLRRTSLKGVGLQMTPTSTQALTA
jgi:alpha-ketoglutarate-dependent 2,4-dichlorophenoxyacetate dioxygenase